jgi:hypothetical protein
MQIQYLLCFITEYLFVLVAVLALNAASAHLWLVTSPSESLLAHCPLISSPLPYSWL